MAGTSVDDIWAEMKQQQQVSKRAVQTKDLSALQREKHKPKRPAAKRLDASLQWMQGWKVPQAAPEGNVGVSYAQEEAADPLAMRTPPTTFIDAIEEIPTGTPEMFLAYIQRDINCLGEESMGVRLQSFHKLERVLVQHVDTLPTDVVDAAVDATLKPLLKRLRDKSEKCRELGVRVLRSLVENASDLSATLPYIFPTLVGRLGCEDLDGVAHLPEVMRPDPEQKPTEIRRPVEESEEVRLQLGHLVAALLNRCNQTQVYSYVDEATGLLRAQAMDPFPEVKALACETMIAFCYNHSEMLLHFAEPMGRSLTSCLTHNHARIRLAALRALTAVLWCGVWKHNHEVLQLLMAWQDPNKVPVKAFYESVTSVNYLSTLTFDRHPMVRRFWFETLAYWMLRLPDKVDHEPYVVPYLLTGLCDENEEIALEVFWLIERCGERYEEEHETDLRKTRQYGFDYGWTYDGRAFVPFPLGGVWAGAGGVGSVRRTAAQGPDLMGERGEHLGRDGLGGADQEEIGLGEVCPLPDRDYAWPELQDLTVFRRLPRPRLGSRSWVRTHTRRYIKATFNDVVDFRDCTALNAGRLLCMSLAYTEEGITEWLQPMLAALTKFYSGRAWAAGDTQATRTYDTVCKLLGAYLDPVSYWAQLRDSLRVDSPQDLDQRIANVHILALCIEGSVHTLKSVEPPDPDLGLGRLASVLPELIDCLHGSDLLLSPTPLSRRLLWDLLFAFLEPLRAQLSSSEVAQLLFICLALSAKPPGEEMAELARGATVELADLEDGGILDVDLMEKALGVLNLGMSDPKPKAPPAFSLDDLDDGDEPAPPPDRAVEAGDQRVLHLALFEHAFPEILAKLDDSLQVLRSVLYLTPLSVLVSGQHADEVLEKLRSFCSATASPESRVAGQALSVRLALRCAKAASGAVGSRLARDAETFLGRLFFMLGEAMMDCTSNVKDPSYLVIASCLSLWRRFFAAPCLDVKAALCPCGAMSSPPIAWMALLLSDQELYKKFHMALENAEALQKGVEKESFVINRARQIREDSEARANAARAMAASTLLVALRRMLQNGRKIRWPPEPGLGSARAVFLSAASLFRTAAPTMDPPYVRPTPPHLTLYAAELLRVLLHQQALAEPFKLLDDAAKAIHQLPAPPAMAALPPNWEAEDGERIAGDFVGALIDLNLSLPPDPNTKNAPAKLGDGAGDILLGWERAMDPDASGSAGVSKPRKSASVVPSEVSQLLAQSAECLRWNAAFALYLLGVDLVAVCEDGFQQCLVKWRRRKEQAKVIVATDLVDRARRVLNDVAA